MFDLETAIKKWRRQTEAKWLGDKRALDELEDHLYEEVAALTRAGQSEQDAWSVALANLGDPAELRREFAKIDRLPTLDRWAFASLLGGTLLAVAAFLVLFLGSGVMAAQPVLSIHITAITLGYGAGLYAASIAAYAAIRGVIKSATLPALTILTLKFVRFTSIAAAALTIVGFIFGAIWANDKLGRPFTSDPREIGAIVVAACFLAVAIATWRHVPAPVSLAITIVAGGFVLAAWFAAGAMASGAPGLSSIIGIGIGFGGLPASAVLAALSLKVRSNVVTQ